jgi:hypothetical protein
LSDAALRSITAAHKDKEKEITMKKFFIIGSIIAVALIALGVAGLTSAQAQNPPTPQPYPGNQPNQYTPGQGMMGGWRGQDAARQAGMLGWRAGFRQGMMGGFARGYAQGTIGPMHEYMIEALAAKLNLTTSDLQAKINAGERPYDIAKAQGLTVAQFQELMEQAHDEALKAAVAAGALTQEQAEAMDKRMEQMRQNGGIGGGFGMMGGRGAGRFGAGGCPGMGGATPVQP